jgi:hypothetical protein
MSFEAAQALACGDVVLSHSCLRSLTPSRASRLILNEYAKRLTLKDPKRHLRIHRLCCSKSKTFEAVNKVLASSPKPLNFDLSSSVSRLDVLSLNMSMRPSGNMLRILISSSKVHEDVDCLVYDLSKRNDPMLWTVLKEMARDPYERLYIQASNDIYVRIHKIHHTTLALHTVAWLRKMWKKPSNNKPSTRVDDEYSHMFVEIPIEK